jgi:hypothetical protein
VASPLSLAAKNGYNGICKELLGTKNQENIDRLTWLLVLPPKRIVKKEVKLFKEKNTTIVKKQTSFSTGAAQKNLVREYIRANLCMMLIHMY